MELVQSHTRFGVIYQIANVIESDQNQWYRGILYWILEIYVRHIWPTPVLHIKHLNNPRTCNDETGFQL